MKPFLTPASLVFTISAAIASSASADDPSGGSGPNHPPGVRGLRHLEKCVSALNLSSETQAAVSAILAAGRPTLEADSQTLAAERKKLHDDIADGAEKSVVGQDTLNVNADQAKLHEDAQLIRDQIASKLPADQQSAFAACAQPPSGRGMGRKSSSQS